MSVEIATLMIEIDATPIDRATKSLERFTAAGPGAESAASRIAAAAAKVNQSYARSVESYDKASRGVNAYASAEASLAQASRGAASASAAVRQQRALEAATMRELVAASKQYEREQATLAARAAALRASTNPLAAAIAQVNNELREASALYSRGALSARDYAQAQTVLTERLSGLHVIHGKGAAGAKLQAHELSNLGSQFADIGVSLASGQALWLVAIQQGAQIGGIYGNAAARGVTLTSALHGIGLQLGILRTVTTGAAAASAGLAVANVAATATAGAATAATAARSTANVAGTVTANAAAIAEAELAAASLAAAAGAGAATTAATGLAAANVAVAETATAAAAAEAVALAPLGVILAAIAVAVAAAAGAFAIGAQQINESNKDILNGLNLTDEQLKKVTHTSVTMGDTIKATFQVAGEAIWDAFGPQIEKVGSAIKTWYDELIANTVLEIKAIVGFFVGGYEAIKATWGLLPGAMGDAVATAANFVLGGIEKMVNGAIDLLNRLSPALNALAAMTGVEGRLGQLDHIKITPVVNVNEGAMRSAGEVAAKAYAAGFAKGGAAVDGTLAKISAQAVKNAQSAALKQAGDAAKGAKAAKGAAAPRDQTDERTAQIEGMIQAALADELQARLGVTREIEARADLERQIARAQEAVKSAQLDRQAANIADDRGLTASKKAELTAQIEIVRSINARSAAYREQAINQNAADALAKEAFSVRQGEAEVQLRVLDSQQDIAKYEFQRRAIGLQRLKIEQQLERAALEMVIASQTATDAQKQIAQAMLGRLGIIHGNETQAAVGDFQQNFSRASNAFGDLASSIRSKDWEGATSSLMNALGTLKEAFSKGGTTGGKIGAIAGLAGMAGQLIGGKAGGVLTGAASGAAAGAMFGPWGAAIGGVIGGVTSLLSGNKAAKAAKNAEALKRAEEELARVREVAAQRADLEIQLLEARGQSEAALAARHKATLAAMDPSLRVLQELVWAEEKLVEVRQKAVDVAQTAVDDARARLTEAYDAEAGAIDNFIGRMSNISKSLKAFLGELYRGPTAMLSPEEQYLRTKAEFDRVDALPAGDDYRLDTIQSVSEEFAAASKAYYASSEQYFADTDRIRAAVTASERYASAQVDVGQAQLTALNASVSGILTVNNSVLSVRDALAGYQAAIQQLAAAQAAQQAANDNAVGGGAAKAVDWGSYIANNSDVAAEYMRNMASAKGRAALAELGATSIEKWGEIHWNTHGKGENRTPYAAGGIMDRPITLGESGIGAEAGSEGILPLANVGGKMGVHAVSPDNGEEKALLRALIAKQDDIINELRADKTQRAAMAEDQQKQNKRIEDGMAALSRTQAARPARAA